MKISSLDQVQGQGLSHDAGIVKKVLFGESALPASVRFSHACFKPGQQVSAHCHEDLYEVFYILSGSAVFCIEGKQHHVAAGSCIRIDPQEMHAVSNNGDTDMNLVYFGLKASGT